ncbi:MAG: flippase-like domain-containing protein [Planctomycetes bacterium]|nr:flippase-like domain-containing protein [Planctomycetota bacterium]
MKLAVKVTVSLALLAGLFAFLWARQGDKVGATADALKRLDAGLWLSILAAFLAGHAVGVFKWRFNVNLADAGLRPTDAVQCYGAGLFANLFLPSIVGGDALKAWLAGKVTGRLEAAIFGGVTERLLDTLALLALIVVGALVSQQSVEGWYGRVLLVGALVGAAGLLVFLPLILRAKLERWPRKIRRPLSRAMVSMRRVARRPLAALGVFLLSVLIQSWFVLLNAWFGRALGIQVPLEYWFLAVPLTKAVTLAPVSLGGLGVREATLAGLLGLVGVSASDGAAASLLWQSVVYSGGLFGGLLWLALGLRSGARTGLGHDSLVREARTAEGRHG